MKTINFKRLHGSANTPQRGSRGAAGFDLYFCPSVEEEYTISIPSGGIALIPTGISIEIPPDHYGRIAPRSGLALKLGIDVMAGVIDSDYRGEIKVMLINHSKDVVQFHRFDRVAQILFERISTPLFIERNTLEDTGRGSLGYGSTGS